MSRGASAIILLSCCAISYAFFTVPGKGTRPWTPLHSLRCWKCENQDFIGCKRNGEIEKCQPGVRQSCQTEIRYSGNRGTPIIKTGCKQGLACSSNKQQNRGAAWSPEQCNSKRQNSVCRCCCAGSLCNGGSKYLLCKFPATPLHKARDAPPPPPGLLVEERSCGPQPETPKNGSKRCFGDTGPRSFCRFECDKGFKLDGSKVSMCARIRGEYSWSKAAPICLKEEICMTYPDTPENGFKSCRGGGRIGSRCFFVCDHGYKRFGPSSVACELTEDGAKWTFKPPTCPAVLCEPLPPVPDNGDYECDGIGELGTRCEFTCDAGYDLIGHSDTVCVKFDRKKGKWNNRTPICKKVRCTFLPRPPTNGHRECTGDGILGTVCDFACKSGYRVKGNPSTACHRSNVKGVARWNRGVPTCEPVCKTMPNQPEYGYTQCEGLGEVGTQCVFRCQLGFEIRGSITTTCKMSQNGAEWSHETPACVAVCKPLREVPEYGEQTCFGEGNIGTSCVYGCDDGFRLEGQSESVCKEVENGADWSTPLPTCIPTCTIPRDLENGHISCEGNGDVGTECSFECETGFRLNGVSQVACQFNSARAGWSNEIPFCEHYCPPLPEHIKHGNVRCEGNGELGTSCNFTCEGEAYELAGESTVKCVLLYGRALWSHESPTCGLRPTCPSIGELEHGKIVCNSDLNVDGTTCEFQCLKQGFSLVPDTRKEVICHRNRTWSKKPCCIDCTKVKRDIMIAMDSSGSIKRDGWTGMITFVQNIIRRFSYGTDATLFSVFQFSEIARSEGWMYFNRYKKVPLIRQVRKMNKMGQGTKTGKGLQYAQKRFRDRGNRKNVPDILFILTDGEADDPALMLKVASQMRRQGVEILALAIAPSENFVAQMTAVTGDKNKVIVAPSIKKLTEDVVDILFSKTCQDERECDRS